MLQVNEYFEGKVKSIALKNNDGNSTVGVISPGEFEFGTTTIEHMSIVSGDMDVLLPTSVSWRTYKKGDSFKVAKDAKFRVKVTKPCAYVCLYIS